MWRYSMWSWRYIDPETTQIYGRIVYDRSQDHWVLTYNSIQYGTFTDLEPAKQFLEKLHKEHIDAK